MTQLAECRQLPNLAVGCHQPARGQEVFSIDMTNRFPSIKNKVGDFGHNRSLSLISTFVEAQRQPTTLLFTFFQALISPRVV